MTLFDGQAVGTDELEWSRCEWLRSAPELAPPTGARLVVLAAHPDDEALGAGGLIGLADEAGLDIYVIFASDGAASHPHSGTHRPEQLAAIRKDEAAAAVLTLAPRATVEFLELPDGELAAHGPQLTAALRTACWEQTVVLAPWAYDGHPDHEACARAARGVAAEREQVELLEFPIWAWHWASPADELATLDPEVVATRRLTLEAGQWRRKQAAIARYPSQIAPLSPAAGDEAVLSPSSLAYFARGFECFFVIAPGGS
ncbi:PIG-L family deacetylase [Jatrophihabitans sp.]|uniref:PIG-L deacetylase family protein n=1 Tax=Jatrophihabitans sp. TaxID=1932789 RepID=UPI0030C6BE6B|nr:hypothetical protein [Jatrophihabitans sp.]